MAPRALGRRAWACQALLSRGALPVATGPDDQQGRRRICLSGSPEQGGGGSCRKHDQRTGFHAVRSRAASQNMQAAGPPCLNRSGVVG